MFFLYVYIFFLYFTQLYVLDRCTGDFLESDINNAGNKKQRPPAGTRCVSPCKIESGRWGSSWCDTEEDGSQWGAECVPCLGKCSFKQILQTQLISRVGIFLG